MVTGRVSRGLIGPLLAALMLVVGPAASASAATMVRFVNARGGGSPVRLEVKVAGRTTPVGGPTAFGTVGTRVAVASGQATFLLRGASSSSAAASASQRIAEGGNYTVIGLPKGSKGYALVVLRDGAGAAAKARLRIFNAAPELGAPDIRLGRRTVAQDLRYKTAAGYLTVQPGAFRLAVAKPNGGAAVFTQAVTLSAGTATTEIVAGSGGTATRLIAANDGTVTPAGAPHTGLGGLARGGGEPWLLALLAALVAGTLGGAAQLTRARRSR